MIKYITALLLIIGFALGQSEGIIINLLNGEQIKGDIIEVVPNQYIVVRTATGEQKRINYTHIDYVLHNVGLENVIQAAAEKAVLERLANAMPGISWTFSNAGATGRFGPTQAQVDAAYAGTTLEDKVTIIFTQESERAVAQESAVEAAAWEKEASNEDTVRMADLATKIIKQVKAGEDFGALAAEYSQDPGSQNIGGELGWFEKGRMVKPFEEAAFGAKKGEFVGPVKSRFGYHIIHVKDKKTENGKEQVNAAHILLKFDISAMTLDNLKQASTLFSYDAQDNGFSAAIDSHKVESGIQEWTVPVTGIYRIEASGAQGGSGCGISSGLGAKISGDFGLRKGSILLIGIGQTGSNGDDGTQSPGGGGGSFIAQGENNATAIPLIIAGGGGGVCKGTTGPDYYETHGRIQKDGGDVNDSEKIYGGVDGSGGKKGGESNDSGSGAGFFSNAGLGSDEYNGVAQGFRSLYPLLGGVNSNNYGGFGGGGGGSNDRGDMDKGGGGGYSGGANAYDYSKGAGGGGSYNSGSNQDNESGVNVGHGKVVITYLQEPSILITNVQVRQEDFEVIITYDMEGELQGKDGVMLAYSTDDGQTYKPISDADGDLGKYVKSGSGRKISFLINAGYAGGNASFEVFVSSTPLGSPWTFSNAGATGRLGPTQTLVNTAYSGSSLEGDVTITTQGIQEWSVPAGGTYTIEAWGAQGGTSSSRSGGSGAKMKGDFILQDKDILNILIGQMGEDLGDCNTGGGGGTFVWDNKESPMIISGGGGGAGDTYNGNNGIITGNGTTANPSGGSPGTNGKGANPGGAGWYSNGREFEGAKGGTRPLNNGTGGSAGTSETGDGGFGGGSGGTGNDCSSHGSGGGGGYSGGAGQGADSYGGGGGGSYNAGTNQDNKSGINTGHGKVVITYVQGASETTIAISGVSSTIEFNGVEDIARERNPELFLPKDEFETTPEYNQRVAQKEALIKGLRTQIITDQKVRIKERARLAAERAVEFERQLQVKITESLVPVEFTPSGLDRYDADKGTFPLTVNGQTYTVAIPRSEARSFKVNYTTAKVEGFKQLQRDLETYNYFDMVVIHPITGSRFPLGSTEAAAKEIILAEEVDLTGMWNLTYDWNCDDESTQSTVTFNADRTGKIGDYVITWGASISAISLGPGKCDDSINFDYNAYYKFDSGTTYYFLVDGDVASGIMDSGGDGTVDGINSMVRK